MNRNRKKAAAATLAAGMAVVLGAGTVMAAASTGDNGLQKEETVYSKYNCRRRSNGCHSI
mgnify:CR=1 FL=1